MSDELDEIDGAGDEEPAEADTVPQLRRTVHHLTSLLDSRNKAFRRQADDLEIARNRLKWSSSGWCLAETVTDEPDLPLPRLEVILTEADVSSLTFVYRLVRKHLVQKVQVVPLGQVVRSGMRRQGEEGPEYSFNGELNVPHSLRAEIEFDAAHLQLPAFLRWGDVTQRVAPGTEWWTRAGSEARREEATAVEPLAEAKGTSSRVLALETLRARWAADPLSDDEARLLDQVLAELRAERTTESGPVEPPAGPAR